MLHQVLRPRSRVCVLLGACTMLYVVYLGLCGFLGLCEGETRRRHSDRMTITGGKHEDALPREDRFAFAFDVEHPEVGGAPGLGRFNRHRTAAVEVNRGQEAPGGVRGPGGGGGRDLGEAGDRGSETDTVDTSGVRVYDVTRPFHDVTNDSFKCINLHVKPRIPICVYDVREDVYVSATLIRGDVWEEHIVKRFQSVLRGHPGACVLDLGANLGQYSLIAASMGHSVLAVEPYLPSLRRFHKAIQLGHFSPKIQVLQNAISDTRGLVNMKANIDNQGDARAYPQNYEQCLGGSCQSVHSIHMNDLIPFTPEKECIIKLDIQGYEHKAFAHVQLLLDKISIPYIFMEWSLLREYYVTEAHQSEDKDLVNGMIRMLVHRGYRVNSLVTGKKLNIKFWHGWPEDVLWSLKES